MLEPFEFHPDTMVLLSHLVAKKLKDDIDIAEQVEYDLLKKRRIENLRNAPKSDYDFKQLEQEMEEVFDIAPKDMRSELHKQRIDPD